MRHSALLSHPPLSEPLLYEDARMLILGDSIGEAGRGQAIYNLARYNGTSLEADPVLFDTPTWADSPQYGQVLKLTLADTESLQFATSLMSGLDEGEVIILAKLTSASAVPIFTNLDVASDRTNVFLFTAASASTALTFRTDDNTTDENVFVNSAFSFGSWHLFGVSFGPLGKAIYVDGISKVSSSGKTASSGTTTDNYAIGEHKLGYSGIELALFCVTEKQKGDWWHRAVWNEVNRAA